MPTLAFPLGPDDMVEHPPRREHDAAQELTLGRRLCSQREL